MPVAPSPLQGYETTRRPTGSKQPAERGRALSAVMGPIGYAANESSAAARFSAAIGLGQALGRDLQLCWLTFADALPHLDADAPLKQGIARRRRLRRRRRQPVDRRLHLGRLAGVIDGRQTLDAVRLLVAVLAEGTMPRPRRRATPSQRWPTRDGHKQPRPWA